MNRVARAMGVAAALGVVSVGGAVALFAASPAPVAQDSHVSTTASATPAPAIVVAPPTRVVLTPTAAPTTSQSISWLAGDGSHVSGHAQFRPIGGVVREVEARSVGTENGGQRQHFSVTLNGLEPATTYQYRVGLEGSWSTWWSFSTADPTETDFEFIYYGDAQTGLNSTWPSVVRQAESTAPGAIGSVHAGDLIDRGADESQWADWFDGMAGSAAMKNVMAAPGNHEYVGDISLSAWKANFEYPENGPTPEMSGPLAALALGNSEIARQYAAYYRHWSDFLSETVYFADYQTVRFITVNATQDIGFLTPPNLPACSDERCPSRIVAELWVRFQATWLDEVLSESPSKWNVVTFHQPVYSASVDRDEPVLRAYWVPVFEDHNVDLVLMGHDHVYARGFKNDDRTSTPGVTTGPVYIVANSGAKHYELTSAEENVWTANDATQVRRGSGVTTYQVIDISEDQLVYRSYLAEKSDESTSSKTVGAIFDEFTITKTQDGRKWVTEPGVEPPR